MANKERINNVTQQYDAEVWTNSIEGYWDGELWIEDDDACECPHKEPCVMREEIVSVVIGESWRIILCQDCAYNHFEGITGEVTFRMPSEEGN